MDWSPARMRRLLETVAERQKFRLGECWTEKRQAHGQVVASESGWDDEIREPGEIGDVGRGCRAGCAAGRGVRGRDERRTARRSRIDNRVQLLRRDDAFDSGAH